VRNLNFEPKKAKQVLVDKKVKKYQGFIFVMWIICIGLYIFYIYNNNKSIETAESINNNLSSKYDKLLAENSADQSKEDSFSAFQVFLWKLTPELRYRSVSIENNNIDLDIILGDKKDYHRIIELIENNYRYKINKLSPIIINNGEGSFKISIEVK
jgi:Ca2+/Na+ antiporter